ncbi:unnamed protein product [Ilex paraguariensis]|uniref:Uncharacterized protein n=1 Tax=Ilex paraguariensis TaxID=185542 RepID=A0ABC8RP91_9AQUA
MLVGGGVGIPCSSWEDEAFAVSGVPFSGNWMCSQSKVGDTVPLREHSTDRDEEDDWEAYGWKYNSPEGRRSVSGTALIQSC